uniref:C2H2-type domain-containing protein n=1 Tax=Plectus sambesii TaxID=2011161 RepID=A0A914VHC4_9BILA
MAETLDETRPFCQHQESVDDPLDNSICKCLRCGKVLEKTKEMLHHAAEKGKHIAQNVADSLSSYVSDEDILEAVGKIKELEQEEKEHLEKETALYEKKVRARTPDSIDLLHEEQMDEHDVRLDIFKRKTKAIERLTYLRNKRIEQDQQLAAEKRM